MNAIFLLPVHLYGPRDNFDANSSHVIPALIRKCVGAVNSGDSEITCWGDGSPTREFLYVEDCAEAILAATERYDKPEPVNLGSGQEVSIRELARKIAGLTGFTGRIVWDKTQPNGQPRRCLDVAKAEREFRFRAHTSEMLRARGRIRRPVTRLALDPAPAKIRPRGDTLPWPGSETIAADRSLCDREKRVCEDGDDARLRQQRTIFAHVEPRPRDVHPAQEFRERQVRGKFLKNS